MTPGRVCSVVWRNGVAALLLAVAAACAGNSGPAPAVVARSSEGAPIPPGGQVTVQAGDTVYQVARRYGVPVRSVIDLNGLRPPYTLRRGQQLRLPTDRQVHIVARGDSLWAIARRYGIDMNALARLNGLSDPSRIFPGQALALPGSAPPTAVASAPPSTPPEPVEPPSVVQTAGPIQSIGLDDVAAPRPPFEPASSVPRPGRKPAQPTQVAAAPSPRQVEAAVPQPPPRASSRFLWPVEGKVTARYGPAGDGLFNDGINIAAERGTPIRAADNGVVVYAGNELRGFGNLLLIKHDDGWITAYAHCDEIKVRRGATVTRGEVVASVGASGNVREPQLHFEVRRDNRAIDPLAHLSRELAEG